MPVTVPDQDADVVLTDEDRIAYWKGAYDRMDARNGDLSRQIAALARAMADCGFTPAPLRADSED